jgi:glutathione S-transferase
MKLYLFPPSARVLAIVALKNHLALDCELNPIDLGRGDQLTPEYLALNPNRKIPTLKDGEFVLWESNAILFYMAAKRPESGLWPSDLRGQADVLHKRRLLLFLHQFQPPRPPKLANLFHVL